jgi:hypothetical protein
MFSSRRKARLEREETALGYEKPAAFRTRIAASTALLVAESVRAAKYSRRYFNYTVTCKIGFVLFTPKYHISHLWR